jgi:hypothetical protein
VPQSIKLLKYARIVLGLFVFLKIPIGTNAFPGKIGIGGGALLMKHRYGGFCCPIRFETNA